MSRFCYIRNSEINRLKWDRCISTSINKRVYALSWYLDVVSENWGGLVYGDYQAVFPIIFKKIGFFKKCYPPFFCQQLGLFYQKEENDNGTLNLLANCLNYLNQKIKSYEFCSTSEFMGVFLDVNSDNLEIKMPSPLSINITRKNLVLNLNLKYSEIASSYNTNTIRNLKRANEASLFIKDYSNPQDVLYFFKRNIDKRANLKSKDFLILSDLMDTCVEKGIGKITGVLNPNKMLIACAFIVSHLKRDIIIYNTSDKNYKDCHGMTYLIDFHIRNNTESDKVLDFEGSNLPGVARFYQGFGAIENNYLLMKSKHPGLFRYTSF